MLHAALLLAPCASVNPPRTRSDTGTRQKLMSLFWSSFDNLLFTRNRIRKVLVNAPIQHGPSPPALSHVTSPVSNIPVLKLNYVWLSLSKAFSTIIIGISFFCQTWLNLDTRFWSYHLHPTTRIQRSYDCKSPISPVEMEGNEPLMLINISAPKNGPNYQKTSEGFFSEETTFFFLVQIVLANPQYYILSAWKSLTAVTK